MNYVSDCKIIKTSSSQQLGDIFSYDLSEICGFNPVKRIYYLFDVDAHATRGAHAHYELKQLIIAASGSFDIELFDGQKKWKIKMNSREKALLVVPGIWRELSAFTPDAVCLVLASDNYLEKDYIRDIEVFKQYRNVKK